MRLNSQMNQASRVGRPTHFRLDKIQAFVEGRGRAGRMLHPRHVAEFDVTPFFHKATIPTPRPMFCFGITQLCFFCHG